MDTLTELTCFHCGDTCTDRTIILEDKHFCCGGCKSVYLLLNRNNLDHYYCLNTTPGSAMRAVQPEQFRFLEEPAIARRLITFSNKEQSQATFYLPGIHCSSCLWLLEHLGRMHEAILDSRVNFAAKELSVSFLHDSISLKQVAELLTAIGYEPYITTEEAEAKPATTYSARKAAYKLGITGFCFANIMLISFPEYLGLEAFTAPQLATFFRYVNLLLALPVVGYGAREFFTNAWYSFRQRYINIDAPIALAITVTFSRSVYEILSGTGAGYLDSMSGIVFFMLLGRTLQNRTYSTLRFNRDYQSYFPVAVTVLQGEQETVRSIKEIEADDRLLLHHQEVVPTDCILSKGQAEIDYSFITGEEAPEQVAIGGLIYAGGKVNGAGIEVIAVKAFSQNSFTRLWNNEIFAAGKSDRKSLSEHISRYFSLCVLLIATAAWCYWQYTDPAYAWNAFTAVLIVACPCALLLTTTFTYGHLIRHFSESGFFVKNARTLEQMAIADCIAFDKTGTITETRGGAAEAAYLDWTADEKNAILSLLSQSAHPLSKAICQTFPGFRKHAVKHYRELAGKGIEGIVEGRSIRAGSAQYVQAPGTATTDSNVWISVDGVIKAHFRFANNLRSGIQELLHRLRSYKMILLSGDNESSKARMQQLFPQGTALYYQCSPQQKLERIQALQNQGHKVLMVGDGLNDAGALQQSDAGIAVMQDSFTFSPACDAIIQAGQTRNLDRYLKMARQSRRLILGGFGYSLLFNLAGLFFAVSGELSPMIAAILMPASSFGIMMIAYTGVKIITRKKA